MSYDRPDCAMRRKTLGTRHSRRFQGSSHPVRCKVKQIARGTKNQAHSWHVPPAKDRTDFWISIYIDLTTFPIETLRILIADSFLYGRAKGKCALLIRDWSKFLINRVFMTSSGIVELVRAASEIHSLEIVTLNSRSRVSPTNDRGEPPPLQSARATRCNCLKRAAWPMKPWHLHITRLTLTIITILMTAASLLLIGLPCLLKRMIF